MRIFPLPFASRLCSGSERSQRRRSFRHLPSIALCTLLALVALPGCGNGGKSSAGGTGGVLRVGIVPYDQPGKLQEEYAPFANYLAGKAGEKAKVFVTQDYSGVAPRAPGRPDRRRLPQPAVVRLVRAAPRLDPAAPGFTLACPKSTARSTITASSSRARIAASPRSPA